MEQYNRTRGQRETSFRTGREVLGETSALLLCGQSQQLPSTFHPPTTARPPSCSTHSVNDGCNSEQEFVVAKKHRFMQPQVEVDDPGAESDDSFDDILNFNPFGCKNPASVED